MRKLVRQDCPIAMGMKQCLMLDCGFLLGRSAVISVLVHGMDVTDGDC